MTEPICNGLASHRLKNRAAFVACRWSLFPLAVNPDMPVSLPA